MPKRRGGTPSRATGRSRVISATEAAKTFGGLVDRVRETRAVYVVERGGTPVAQIGPVTAGRCTVADLVDLLRTQDRLEPAYLGEVEAGVATWNRPGVPEDRWAR